MDIAGISSSTPAGYVIVYLLAALAMIIFSFMAVRSRRILRAATYLLFALISTAVMYFQLGYQFLGAVQIAVYAGGIMVLFVFAILLTHHPDEKSAPLTNHRKILGIGCSVCGAVLLILALFNMPVISGMSINQALAASEPVTMDMIGKAFTGSERFQYLLPFEAVSVLLLACIIGGVVVTRKR